MPQVPDARGEVGRPGLDPGTLGLEVPSGPFHRLRPLTDTYSELHRCVRVSPVLAAIRAEL